MTIDITPEAVEQLATSFEALLSFLDHNGNRSDVSDTLRALSAALTQSQADACSWEQRAIHQNEVANNLDIQLTQSRAETAAAYDVAANEASKRAKFTRAAIAEATANSIVANLVSVTQTKTANKIEDAIRALATPGQLSALAAIEAAAEARGMRKAAEVAAQFVHKRLYEVNFPACSYHSREINAAILAAIPHGEVK